MTEHRRAYMKAYGARYYKAHREHLKKRAAIWTAANRPARATITNRYKVKHRDKIACYEAGHKHLQKNRNLRFQYNLSLQEYRFLLDVQGGCCLGCKRSSSDFKLALAVDEMPCTRGSGNPFIRGLLCGQCNTALGLLKDSPSTLRRLAVYSDTNAARFLAYTNQICAYPSGT